MYVCLCNGVASKAVQDAIEAGARSTKDVAAETGAGAVCGRCIHTIGTMIAAHRGVEHRRPLLRRWGRGRE